MRSLRGGTGRGVGVDISATARTEGAQGRHGWAQRVGRGRHALEGATLGAMEVVGLAVVEAIGERRGDAAWLDSESS